MGLKRISSAGDMADRLRDAAQVMNTVRNIYQGRYESLLAAIQGALGAGKKLGNLSDQEVNSFFFGGLGDTEAIINAQSILREWEKLITSLGQSVSLLPANDV